MGMSNHQSPQRTSIPILNAKGQTGTGLEGKESDRGMTALTFVVPSAKDLAIEKLTKFLLAERKRCRIGPLGEVGAVLDSPFAQLTVSYSTASDSEARWATPPELRRS